MMIQAPPAKKLTASLFWFYYSNNYSVTHISGRVRYPCSTDTVCSTQRGQRYRPPYGDLIYL